MNARRAGSSFGQLGMTMVARQGAGRGTCLLVLVLLAGGANGSPIDHVPDDGSDLRWLAVAESLALLIGAEGLPLVARRVERFLSQLRGHEGESNQPLLGLIWPRTLSRQTRLGLMWQKMPPTSPQSRLLHRSSPRRLLGLSGSNSTRLCTARTPPTRRTAPTRLRLQQRHRPRRRPHRSRSAG